MPKPAACRVDYPARSLADIRLCPIFLQFPHHAQNVGSAFWKLCQTLQPGDTQEKRTKSAALCRRGEKPYILGGRARNCRVCKMNNLQGNFCQFKKDGVVCPEPLQVRARCRLLEAQAVARSLVQAGAARLWCCG